MTASTTGTATAAGQSRPLIIIADDDREARGLIAASLRRANMDVIEVSDGDELLASLQRLERLKPVRRPDVVLSDVHMPGRNGLEVLVKLQSHWPKLPVVMMTATANGSTRARAQDLGATLLDKPLDLEALKWRMLELSRG
jgi:CheY-like chemotaxis protein